MNQILIKRSIDQLRFKEEDEQSKIESNVILNSNNSNNK